jgi:dTDP-4-dehydrorhamnose reductase
VAAAGGDWLVFRTSWVYGARGKNFLRTMLRLASERETLNVVADQCGAPTPARMIADATGHIVRQSQRERNSGGFESGIFHLTASGTTTWHGFASKIVDDAKATLPAGTIKAQQVKPIPTSAYPAPARRPANSELDNTKFQQRFRIARPSWQSGADCVLGELFERALAG